MIDSRPALEADLAFMSEMERYDAFQRLYHSSAPEDAATLDSLAGSLDPLIPLILLRFLEEIPEKKACNLVIRLIEGENEVVAAAAMGAYQRSHYPGKTRLLKPLILSPSFRACRFAARTLSRAGFMEILPLLLREIPDKEGEFLIEFIGAVRYLPHLRSVPVILPFADAAEEPVRYLAMEVLGTLQARTRAVPVSFFLRKLKDPSERVRRSALDALQAFSTRRVAPLILAIASDPSERDDARVRAIRAAGAFPAPETVRIIVSAASGSQSTEIRLAAEVVLRHFPAKLLRRSLLPLLAHADTALRRQAAVFLAEFLPEDPEVRAALFRLWRGCGEELALEFIEPLQILGGSDTVSLLREAVAGDRILSYAAATALSRMRGEVSGTEILAMLERAPSSLVRQALLDRWAKRGPDASIKALALPKMLAGLEDSIPNNRYLALQVLRWYPLSDTLSPLLDLLAREALPDIVKGALAAILEGLRLDPMPLVRAVAGHAARERLLAPLVSVLISRSWDMDSPGAILDELSAPPLQLAQGHFKRFAAVCLHLLRHGSVTLQDLWLRLVSEERKAEFLRMLIAAASRPRRRFPSLPVPFLELQAALAGSGTRPLIYDLMALQGAREGAEYLAAALLREDDPDCLRHGRDCLRRLLLEEAR